MPHSLKSLLIAAAACILTCFAGNSFWNITFVSNEKEYL